jgi:hypothetical protein
MQAKRQKWLAALVSAEACETPVASVCECVACAEKAALPRIGLLVPDDTLSERNRLFHLRQENRSAKLVVVPFHVN